MTLVNSIDHIKTQDSATLNPTAKWLLDRNATQSTLFSSEKEKRNRRRYRAQHPTEFAAWKCMDGRLNLPVFTKTPPGIIQPYRTMGGKFDLGWPLFGLLTREWINYATSRSRDCIILITYHFSRGEPHRGCKGFEYDTEAAKASAFSLRAQSKRFCESISGVTVYPIVVGMETDEDALIFHGVNGDELDATHLLNLTESEILSKLQNLFPDLPEGMLEDLLPLVVGNIAHIRELRNEKRSPIAIDHCEQVIVVGRGVDWLHQPNKALIIGPWEPDLPAAIRTAGTILLNNLNGGKISKEDGVALLTCGVYRDPTGGSERILAEEKARYLRSLAEQTLRTDVPDLIPHLDVLSGAVDLNTRQLHRI